MKEDLGLRLKTARQRCGFSQTKLAEKVGINQNNIAQYEAGKALPKLETIVKFSQILGCSIEWLITGNESQHQTDEKTKSSCSKTCSKASNQPAKSHS
jgi:transcriptional regulator with XRE-family HTH domain